MSPPFDAILFDLLTGLLDSWSHWDRVAGGPGAGREWRLRYLDLCYGSGPYSPFEKLVLQSALDVGLGEASAQELLSSWDRLELWPEVDEVLPVLNTYRLGLVTNCSEALAERAALRVGVPVSVMVSAERAGAYKPEPRPYRLALSELDLPAERVLFVAGSPSDILGASRVGMTVFWHNRLGLVSDLGSQAAFVADSLHPLRDWLLGEVSD